MKKENVKKFAVMSVSAMMMLSLMSSPIHALDDDTVKEEVVEETVKTEETATFETNDVAVEEETNEEEQLVTQSEETETTQIALDYKEGVTVVADAESPTGYTAHFVYNSNKDTRFSVPEEYHVDTVTVTGSFRLLSAADNYNDHSLREYKNGDFVANVHPYARSTGRGGIAGAEWPFEMTNVGNGYYTLDIPMVSGAHYYYMTMTFADADGNPYQVERTDRDGNKTIVTYSEQWDDLANPSPCRDNEANSDSNTGDITHSIVYGKWDSVKQSKSPNLDYMTPYDGPNGKVEYKTYAGSRNNHQDLGVYLPPNYDPNRTEPYKVIYLSHGAGGNETYWFSQPQAANVMDHVIAENPDKEAIIVGLDNTLYSWDYYQIGQNVVNYVIPFIEANYNVSKEAKDRAFAGFSMGSMTTTYMAFHHADKFDYFGIFSGCNIGNATFKDGFEYDARRLQNSVDQDEATKYLQEVYANIEPSKDLLNSLVFTMAGNVDTAVYANGFARYGAYETIRDWAKANMPEGNFVDGGFGYGSHDIYTWGQCIYEFAKVCWSKNTTDTPVTPDQPTTPDEPKAPNSSNTNNGVRTSVKTGDDTNLMAYGTALALSALVAGSSVVLKKKKKRLK